MLTLLSPTTRRSRLGFLDRILAVVVLGGVSIVAQAQFTYTFTAVSGTYTQVSAGGSDLNTVEVNDAHSASVPLGFDFGYDGLKVSSIKVNSNGWISMDDTDSPSSNEGRNNSIGSTASAVRPAIMPLWDDLDGTNGTARYETTGSAGSRVFTMEWRNWQWDKDANNFVISFECKLYEGTNVIEFIYRQEANAVNNGSSGASIGLVSGTASTYHSLNGTGASPTASTSTATNNLSTRPATGQIYRFTPSGCSGPSISSTTSNSPICAGSTLNPTVTATGTAPLFYSWTGTGTFSDATVSNPSVTGAATGTYSVTVKNWCGTSTAGNTSVTVSTTPTTSAAGPDQTICITGTATLAANNPSSGVGAWSVVSGPSTSLSQFSSTAANNAVFTPAAGSGTYTLRWTVSNSPCTASTDNVVITVNAMPTTADAGPDQTICSTPGTANLSGNAASSGTDNWSFISGPVTPSISASGSPNTAVTGMSAAGTYIFQWTITNAPCTASSDQVTITVNAPPSVNPGSYGPFCNNQSAIALNASPAGGNWSGNGTSGANFDPAVADAGIHTLTYSVVNGPCAASANTSVTVNQAPTNAVATSSAGVVCAANSINLNASASNGVLISENFNGATTWTTTNSSTGGTVANAAWTTRPNSYAYTNSSGSPAVTTFTSNDASQFYLSNSDAQGSGSTTSTTLVSPAFSSVGHASLSLNFFHYYRFNSGASDRARVEVSTDGSAWTTVQTYSSTQGAANAFASATINLNAYAGLPTVYVRFRYAATFDWYWAVDNVTITGDATGALSYAWVSNPAGFTSSSQNPTGVAVNQNTTYTVTVSTAAGCSTSNAVSVTTVAPPNAGTNGTTTVCSTDAGFALFGLLGGTPDAGGAWTLGGSSVSGTFTPGTSTPGIYIYTVTGTSPCANASATVTVNVNTAPNAGSNGSTTVCNVAPAFNLVSVLGGSPDAGGSWTLGGSPVSGTYTPGTSTPGAYTYTVTGLAPCANASATVTIAENIATAWYDDTDNDGYGDPALSVMACGQPTGFVADNTDDCIADPNKNDPGNCGCGVVDLDSDGDLTYDCNDGCPLDPNKTSPGTCGCGVVDADSDGDGSMDCVDLCPNDPNKIAPGNCGCGAPEAGTVCDDGSALTGNDMIQGNCTCQGQLIDCLGVAGGSNLPGTSCDDGNSATINDTWNSSCACVGTVVTCQNSMVLEFQTDANGSQTTWQVNIAGGSLVALGPEGPAYGNNTTAIETFCLPNGCYELKVFDSFGDGMTTGGYKLRLANGDRVIDNTANGSFGTLSQAPSGFCLPISDDRLTPSTSDRSDLAPGDWIQASVNAAVSAQYGVNNNTNGYQFWFFNPNGGYNRRILISHAFNNYWFPAGPERASYLKMSSITSNPLPLSTMLNVRVRIMLSGVYGEFGPAVRLTLASPSTQLVSNIASPNYSCGITGVVLNSGQYIHADVVSGATKYQWEFTRPGYLRKTASTGSALIMNTWSTAPLQPGLTYNVRVRVSFDGGTVWGPYGASCTVGIAAPAPLVGGGLHAMAQADQTLDLRMWPNPNREGRLHVELARLPEGVQEVTLAIFDQLGQQVMRRSITVEGGLDLIMELNPQLATGVYSVQIEAGTTIHTRRLVVE